MLDAIVQTAIVVLGGAAIVLLGSKRGSVRRWGYVVGVASEPFWIYASWQSGQWGVIALAFWWTVFYVRGAVNNWRVQ